MADYTVGDLVKAAYFAGFRGPDVALAAAISLAENPSRKLNATHRNSDGSIDRGAWQINSVHNFSGNAFDLQTNADQAYAVFKSQGWGAWTTYNTGKYKMYTKRTAAAAHNPKNAVKVEHGFDSPGAFIHANQYILGKGVDGAKTAGGALVSTATAVPTLIGHILSPSFWRIVGIGALALLLIIIGAVVLLESNKSVRAGTIEAGKVAALA